MNGKTMENVGIFFAIGALICFGWFCLAQLVEREFFMWFIIAGLFGILTKITWKKFLAGEETTKVPRICWTICATIAAIMYSFKSITQGSHRGAFWLGVILGFIAMVLIIASNEIENRK